MPCPKLMIMVSFCWKMNFPHNKIKINSALLMMSLKLTIKVVASFWATLYNISYTYFCLFDGDNSTVPREFLRLLEGLWTFVDIM